MSRVKEYEAETRNAASDCTKISEICSPLCHTRLISAESLAFWAKKICSERKFNDRGGKIDE